MIMATEATFQTIPSFRKIELDYLAIQIAERQQGKREFVSQTEAYNRFGKDDVKRWVSEGLQRYKRPGKIEYREKDLYERALNPYDY